MNAKNITLRPGRPADATRIAAMSRDLIETGLGWSWGPDRVSRSIANKDTSTLLACERDRVVAFAIMYFGDEHAHLNLLAVRPSHQRLGIGRHMVEWLVESAYAAGVATIHLELRASNYTARSFYRSLAFTESAYIPGYYRGREMALRMVRVLRRPGIPLPAWSAPKLPKT
ncbi:MAG TPA: GNAT family N-acetyltransferase [Burkholderiales bacterium]|jgi:ribosomal-protein-alanine N-acetyltransferase|nr:GNAT family N-acetyltransferase [Burkholderiales bacterium]